MMRFCFIYVYIWVHEIYSYKKIKVRYFRVQPYRRYKPHFSCQRILLHHNRQPDWKFLNYEDINKTIQIGATNKCCLGQSTKPLLWRCERKCKGPSLVCLMNMNLSKSRCHFKSLEYQYYKNKKYVQMKKKYTIKMRVVYALHYFFLNSKHVK